MRVEFLDGPTLAEELPALVERSKSIDIAMAYVKISRLRTLMKSIDSLLRGSGTLRILFGLSSRYAITDGQSARALLDLSKKDRVIARACEI